MLTKISASAVQKQIPIPSLAAISLYSSKLPVSVSLVAKPSVGVMSQRAEKGIQSQWAKFLCQFI
jgi:hypothetical protein